MHVYVNFERGLMTYELSAYLKEKESVLRYELRCFELWATSILFQISFIIVFSKHTKLFQHCNVLSLDKYDK